MRHVVHHTVHSHISSPRQPQVLDHFTMTAQPVSSSSCCLQCALSPPLTLHCCASRRSWPLQHPPASPVPCYNTPEAHRETHDTCCTAHLTHSVSQGMGKALRHHQHPPHTATVWGAALASVLDLAKHTCFILELSVTIAHSSQDPSKC